MSHEGFIDPTFSGKLKEFDPDIKAVWNSLRMKYEFWWKHPGRTGIGQSQVWHNPMKWHAGDTNPERRKIKRAVTSYQLDMRAKGYLPIMDHGPEEGELNELSLIWLINGDNENRPQVEHTRNAVLREFKRDYVKEEIGSLDTDMFMSTVRADGSPYKNIVDIEAKQKIYRDDRRSEMGMKPVSFDKKAGPTPSVIQVPR